MEQIKRPIDVDTSPFEGAGGAAETKYGLPGTVQFCKRCVISNQRPNSAVEFRHTADTKKTTIHFDDDGVCDACRVAEEKARIDWLERERELNDLCDRYRRADGEYDCLVPGSGGKDSFYAAHVLKYQFGMHPLTVTWAPHIYTDWGWQNFQRWIHAGFDNILATPNGRVHRLLTRLALENLFHPFQPFIMGQKNIAPKMSALYKIPLVFYGENEAEYGNAVAENTDARRDLAYFADNDFRDMYFGGVAYEDLPSHGIEPGQMEPYLPASAELMDKAGVEVHYLGYYLEWTPQANYYYAVEHTGFEANVERTEGTYSKYNSIDDKTDPFHYWTTYVKFGIGRATYDAAQEIRNDHITREEGVALVNRYDHEFPAKYFPEFLDYLGMGKEEFFEIADRARSPHLWRREGADWLLRHKVT